MPVILDRLEGFVDRGDDPPGKLLQSRQLPQCPHPFLGVLAIHQVRRLIAGCARPSQHAHVRAIPLAQRLAHGMPEVGVEIAQALDFLRRARHVDRNGDQFSRFIPEEQRPHVVILIALQAAKIRPVCLAIHHRMAVGVEWRGGFRPRRHAPVPR